MTKIEAFGSPDEQAEQNKQEKIFSVKELGDLIGVEIVGIRDYYDKSPEDWVENFKKGLSRIEILINSEEVADFFDESILEKVPSRIRTLMEDLDNLNSDKLDELSEEEKNILLEKLNNLFG